MTGLIAAVDAVLANAWKVHGLRAVGIGLAEFERLRGARNALAKTPPREHAFSWCDACDYCGLARADAPVECTPRSGTDALGEALAWLDDRCNEALETHGAGIVSDALCEVRERLRGLARDDRP